MARSLRARPCLQNSIVTAVLLLILGMFIFASIRISGFARNTLRPDLDVGLSETRIVYFDAEYFEGWIGGPAALNDPTPLAHDNFTGPYIQLMRFEAEPPLNMVDVWGADLVVNISSAKVFYWSRYFYVNSSISLSWDVTTTMFDRKVPVPFWFVKSKTNDHNLFANDLKADTTLYAKGYSIISSGFASNMSNISYVVEEDSFYFLFLWNNNTFSTRADIKYNLTNRIHDVSNPIETCMLPCTLDLPYNQEGQVLILVSPLANNFVSQGFGSANSHFTFHAKLKTRTWFFSVVLGFVAVGFIIVEFIVCCFCTACDELGEDIPTRFREAWKCVDDSGAWIKKKCGSSRRKSDYQKINSPSRRRSGRGWAESDDSA